MNESVHEAYDSLFSEVHAYVVADIKATESIIEWSFNFIYS